jgi:hypothetical protein
MRNHLKPLRLLLLGVFLVCGCNAHYTLQTVDHVDLYLKDAHAREVLFLSSLDGFERRRAEKIDEETWKVTVLNGAEFKYFYLIDGNIHVPECTYREQDDFGAFNCLFRADM